MELLVHINKRVKSRPKIQLPLPELLAQYKDPEASPFVTVSFLEDNYRSLLINIPNIYI